MWHVDHFIQSKDFFNQSFILILNRGLYYVDYGIINGKLKTLLEENVA